MILSLPAIPIALCRPDWAGNPGALFSPKLSSAQPAMHPVFSRQNL